MELKRLIVKTKLLLDDIVDINKASFLEIRADSEEVTSLWNEYRRLRSILIQSHPLLFSTLPEHTIPEPYLVTWDSYHQIGTLVFKPEHFDQLRLEVEKILSNLKALNTNKKYQQSYTRKKFRA